MWAVWASLYLAAAVATHAALCRLPLPSSSIAKFAGAGGVSGLALGLHQVLLYGSDLEVWAALLLFAFGCELYVFLFTFVSSSVTVSLLLHLRNGSLAPDEIDRGYSSDDMVARRLERLVANRFLSATSSGYALTRKGRLVLAVFDALRRFFRHPGGAPVESAVGPEPLEGRT